MEKRWNITSADPESVLLLQQSLKVHKSICRMLVSRGINTFEEARKYFRPALQDLHDPFLMKDMDKAVERLSHALAFNEKILVYGDYDVDGTTSVATMVRFLQSQNAIVDYYVPHRYREGYGVSAEGIAFAITNNFQLIITIDCGIKAVTRISQAQEAGIDCIICDHHLPDETLPPAVAILNAKQPDCHYPYKELCGCGVALKLIQAVCKHLALKDECWHPFLQLATIAIAADIVPITGENRIIAYYGLQQINQNPYTCLKALFKLSTHRGEVHINTLVFVVAPRINAAGRMDDAKKAIQLFLEDEYDAALRGGRSMGLSHYQNRLR